MQPTKAELQRLETLELQRASLPKANKVNTRFEIWVLDLSLVSSLNPDIDSHVRAEATAFRRKYATRLKAKELQVLRRLEQSPQAAKLLASCLTDLDLDCKPRR